MTITAAAGAIAAENQRREATQCFPAHFVCLGVIGTKAFT